jgi:hypothetical protein
MKASARLALALAAVVAVALLMPGAAQADTAESQCLNTAHVNGTNNSTKRTNYGGAVNWELQSGKKFAFIECVVGNIPAGATNVSAALQVYSRSVNSTHTVRLHNQPASWTESTVTWNVLHTYDAAILDSQTAGAGTDVSLAASTVTGNGTWRFALETTSSSTQSYASDDYLTIIEKRPKLVVTYSPAAPPTPTPPATPTPPPPTPTPSGTVYTVPTSIDATGASDASAGLNAWLVTVPDGTAGNPSILSFPAGGVFRMDHGLKFGGNATVPRHYLTFEGNGATLQANGAGDVTSDSPFALWNDNTDIAIRDFAIRGNNPQPGQYQGALSEGQMGILIFGGGPIEIANVDIANTYSDGIFIGGGGNDAPSHDIWIHDSDIHDIGRMGISPVSTTGTTIERVDFVRVNWVAVDIEPELNSTAANHIIFRDSTVGPQPATGYHSPSFVSVGGPLTTNVGDITIANNQVTGGRISVDVTQTSRRYNITVTDNTSDYLAAGPVMTFAHIDGLTILRNSEPLSSGPLYTITDSTGVITE